MNKTTAAIVRTLLLGTSCLSVVGVAKGDPTGGTVVAGQGTITQHGGNSTVIDQKTGKLVINWDSFSIGAGGTVKFNQPNSSAIALNRVTGSQPTSIYGQLLANGNVWIINGNGILFGKGSQVQVGGLIATTADIRDGDFLGGNYAFSGGTGASVVNQGTIKARKGGSVLLSGASVSNQGLIAADTGTVVLGGSSAYTVDFEGDGLLRYAITAPTGKADNGQTGVSNAGTIKAAGGRVVMTARAAANVQDAVINNTGMISASSARVQNGEVIFDGGGSADVNVSGSVAAAGTGSSSTGGTVTMTGRTVTVADNTQIDVSGQAGGGTVKIGGDIHGSGTLTQADNVHVGTATINADAGRRGNGGSLIVWSTGDTSFAANFSAKGGAQSGNGGFVETSGHNLSIAPTAKINTSAPHGATGNWLLDPYDIWVAFGNPSTPVPPDGVVGVNDPDATPGSITTIGPDSIITALQTTNVTLEASFNIAVYNALNYNSANTLSLLSGGELQVAASIQNSGTGAINLIAGWDQTSHDFSNLKVDGTDTRFGLDPDNGSVNFTQAISVGSAGGTLTIAGYDVTQYVSGTYTNQIGYHGAGGGDIVIAAQHDLLMHAVGSGDPAVAMIGNGDKLNPTTGAATGNISVLVGGTFNKDIGSFGVGWIGNVSTNHGETGNVYLQTNSVNDTSCCGSISAFESMFAADLAGGNVTWASTSGDITIANAIDYNSAHDLTLLSTGSIGFSAGVQNAGAGNITVIAGWDGTSSDFSNLTIGDSRFGNSSTANVALGIGQTAVGSAGGTTTVAGYNVALQAQSNGADAQIGYHGAGGGNIVVAAQNQVSLFAGEGTNALAMIGNGDKLGSVAGPVTGDITILAGNVLRTQVYTGGTLWIGNAATGGETGNLTLTTGAVVDASCCGFEGQGSIIPMIAADLVGGDVTWESTAGDIAIDNPLVYSSTHTLSLLSVENLDISADIQNTLASNGGAINLFAGWDGVTAPADVMGTPGAFGNNTGTITIGAGEGSTGVAVGGASGTVNVAADSLFVDANSSYSQLGYRGVGGGDINVQTTSAVILETTDSFDAMIGNGSFQEGDEGDVTGNIDVRVGGLLGMYDDNNGDLGEHVWIGNVSASFAETGNVTLIAHDGDVPSSFADMIAADLQGGDFTVGFTGEDGGSIGGFSYDSSHDFTALSSTDLYISGSIQNDGSGAINLVAGWDGVSTNFADIRDNQGYGAEGYGTVIIDGYYGGAYVGSKSGATNVLTGNLVVETGFDEGTNAQLGYHGNGTGNITVLATGDVSILGGDTTVGGPYAMIGNGALDGSVSGDVGGDIFVSALGTLRSETLDGAPSCGECGFTGGGEGETPPGDRGPLHDPGLPFVTGIGNATSDGALSGTTTLLAGGFDDEFDTNGGFGRMVAGDLAYGDVTMGHIGCGCSLDITSDIIYDSSHTLNLVSISDVDIEAKVQNSGTGTINVVAGWDGDLGNIGVDGHYGIDDQGTVNIGSSNEEGGDAWIGTAAGTTNVYGANLSLNADNGYAQLGYHGAGGGAINVNVTQNINMFGSSVSENAMQLGNGSLMGDVEGDVTGDIYLKAGNQAVFFSQEGASWLGNFAGEGYKETGNVTSLAATGSFSADFMEADLGTSADTGGDLFIGFNGPSDAEGFHISGIEFNSPHSMVFATTASLDVTGSVINDGTGAITLVAGWDGVTVGSGQDILTANAYGLNGTHMNIGGDHHYSIGDDFEFDNNQTADMSVGSAGGRTLILAGDINIAPSEGFYAQIGYHGIGGGDIQVVSTGDVTLTGGGSASEYAMIGNGALNGDVEGQATGNVSIFAAGTVTLASGVDEGGNVWIGDASGLTPSGNLTIVAADLTDNGGNVVGDVIGNDLYGGDVLIGLTGANSLFDQAVSADSAHTLSLLATGNLAVTRSVQNAGTGAINVIAGWDGTTFDTAHLADAGVYGNGPGNLNIGDTENANIVAVGSAGGSTLVAGRGVYVTATTADAQIGYRGSATGGITVLAADELEVSTNGAGLEAQIGNGGSGLSGTFGGAINIHANSLSLTTAADNSAVRIGNGGIGSQGNASGQIDVTVAALIDLSGYFSGTFVQIGNGGANASGTAGGAITVNGQTIDMLSDSASGDLGVQIGNGGIGHTGVTSGDIHVTATSTFDAFAASAGTTVFVGNKSDIYTGNVTLKANTVSDLADTIGDVLAGGDLTIEVMDSTGGFNLAQTASYSSAHTLNILSKGGVVFSHGVQNGGNGAINVVAGWDGTTLDPAHFFDAGAYANNNAGVTVGGSTAREDVAVGSANGATHVAGAYVTVDGEGNVAQLGYGSGPGTGIVTIVTPGAVNLNAGAATGSRAVLGNQTGGLIVLASAISQQTNTAVLAASANLNAATGNIALSSSQNNIAGILRAVADHGSISVASQSGMVLDTIESGADTTISSGGNITQMASRSLNVGGALSVTSTGGDITLIQQSNIFGDLTVSTTAGHNATITKGSAINVASANVGGLLSLDATTGDITQTGAITVAGLDVSTSAGNIALTNAGNNIHQVTVGTAGDASITNSAALLITGASVGGTLTLNADGQVSQTGGIAAGTLDITVTSGSIGLFAPDNNFANLRVTNLNGGAGITDSGSVNVTGANVGGQLALIVAEGGITQSGAIHAATLRLSAASAITLGNASNSFATLYLNTDGAADLVDSTGVAIGTSHVGGVLTLHAGGAVTQVQPAGNAPQQTAPSALSAGGLDISTSAGGITLDDPSNHITGTAAFSAPGDIAYTNDGAIDLGQISTDGKVTVRAGGAITQSGYLHAATLDAATSADGITLLNKGNAVSNNSAQGAVFFSAPGDVAFYDTQDIIMGTTNVTGALSLSTDGEIGQVGAIHSGALSLTEANGFALDNASNLFGPITATGRGGSLTSSGAIVIASVTLNSTSGLSGELDLTAHGTITQTGAIHAGSLGLTALGGAIALNDAGNDFNTLNAVTTGGADASVRTTSSLFLAGIQVSGKLTVNAGGSVTQGSPLQTAGLSITAASGDILLTNLTGNAVSGPVSFIATGGKVAFYNTLATTVTGVAASGDVTLLSKGNIAFLGSALSTNGNVAVVAGWDGSTTDSAAFGNSGVWGNGTGSVIVGGLGAGNTVAVGAQHGTTAVYGYSVTLGLAPSAGAQAQDAPLPGYAQIGYHGVGGGAITVRTLGDLTLNGTNNRYAMIGNGSLASDVAGAVGGDIDVRVGGTAFFNAVTGSQSWIGNKTSSGGETGNVIILAGDSNGTQDCDLGCFAQADIIGGDVTLGVSNTDDREIDDVISYNSSHALTLLLGGNITISGSLQNAGTGAVTLVAGWDGHTLGNFGAQGVFGNGGKGVTIGGADAEGNSAIGSAGGTTSIYGASLALSAQHGYAQIGFNGHGTGAVVVDVTGAVTLTGGASAGQFAQIGNGGLLTSGSNGGDILITAGGTLTLTGGAGTEAYAQIGHGGAESNTNAEGYGNVADIEVSAANVILNAGAGQAAYVQIGNGGYKSGIGLSGTASNGGDITVTSGAAVSLTGNGADGYAQIGNGGSQSNLNATAGAHGSTFGDIIVHAPNGPAGAVTLAGGPGANAYAQIGNGGYAVNSGPQAVAANFTITGDVTVTDLALSGSSGPNTYAQIGNGDASLTGYGNVSGDTFIFANGNISYTNGAGPHSPATIGNFIGQGTVTGTVHGAIPAPPGEGDGGDGDGGDVTNNPGTIGVIVVNTAGNNPPNNPPITTINTFIVPPDDTDNGGATTVSLEHPQPGPLALLDTNGADSSSPYSADSATVVIADSLDGSKKPTSTQMLMPGMLKQTGGLGQGGPLHGVPPADQDFSSWGNEALWQ